MLKWILYGVFGIAFVVSWFNYSGDGSALAKQKTEITALNELGDGDAEDQLPEMERKLLTLESNKTFSGIFFACMTTGLIAVALFSHIIPLLTDRMSQSVFNTAEEPENDPMHNARVLVEEGDFDGAIECYKLAAKANPQDRQLWLEIITLQKDFLLQPFTAVQTLTEVLGSQEWVVDDAAFFMFRLVEIYDVTLEDRDSAVSILNQVVETFPETRHSANAKQKLMDIENGGTIVAQVESTEPPALSDAERLAAEEAEFLAKMQQKG